MKRSWLAALLVLVAAPLSAQTLTQEQQITAALLAAPEDLREGARVLGWLPDGKVVELRAGANDMVCISDDPRDDQFEVSCYHETLEPYMARGRELRAQGVENTLEPRWQEIKEGKLAMPAEPTTQYVLGGHEGARFDPATGTAPGAVLRWNIHIPGATAESTGLTTKYAPGAPWIMYPGTPGAHIMIVPPMPGGE